jgi:GxxExxY protein
MLTKVLSTLPPDIDHVIFQVIGAAIEVHRHLGPGFLESIYQRAMCVELEQRGISFDKKKRIAIVYKGRTLQGQELDLIVECKVVVEVKAVSQLEEIHVSQLVSYLKATGLRGGLLINFNKPVLKDGIRRVVR